MIRNLEIPFINVRDLVIFPQMTQDLYIGREQTIKAIQYALSKGNKKVLVLTQKQFQNNTPKGFKDMYSVGTICSVEGSILLQDGTMKAVLTGESILDVEKIFKNNDIAFARGKLRKELKQTKAIEKSEKLYLLELLVRAKPHIAVNDDITLFEKLKLEKSTMEFTKALQVLLNYRGPTQKQILKKVKIQQQLLEEKKYDKKLEILKNYLKFEIKSTANHF